MGASASGHKLSRPASLVLLEGECLPKNVVLTAGMNTIGRKSPTSVCSIQLESGDTFMSRDHACIEFAVRADGMFEYRLSDNASSNGTFLNEKRVDRGEAMILSLNDRIRLGHTIFKFVIE
jgi:pSer/pThr/pTyr-binding forkhead associated (FHA) protein